MRDGAEGHRKEVRWTGGPITLRRGKPGDGAIPLKVLLATPMEAKFQV